MRKQEELSFGMLFAESGREKKKEANERNKSEEKSCPQLHGEVKKSKRNEKKNTNHQSPILHSSEIEFLKSRTPKIKGTQQALRERHS